MQAKKIMINGVPGAGCREPVDPCDHQQAPNALHRAAANNELGMVARLIVCGYSVSSTIKGGWTPLHVAAQFGSLRAAIALQRAGAEVESRNLGGVTPLHLAAAFDHSDMVDFLITKGA